MPFTRTYPVQFNREAFHERLKFLAIEAIFRQDHFEVSDDTKQSQVDDELAAHDYTQQTTEQQQEADKQSILSLATTAKNYTSEIKAIWTEVINADYNANDTDIRFTNIRTAVAAQGTGFKTALHTALESETGLTTLILDTTPTAIQKQAYNQWIRSFCLTWSFMIVLAT